MKQLENDLQCKNESDVIGWMDSFGGTGVRLLSGAPCNFLYIKQLRRNGFTIPEAVFSLLRPGIYKSLMQSTWYDRLLLHIGGVIDGNCSVVCDPTYFT